MKDQTIFKMTFGTRYGNYEFMVNLPFGLTNAQTAFMTSMNPKYLENFVPVFMDDIMVYSKSKTKRLKHLRTIFQVLKTN